MNSALSVILALSLAADPLVERPNPNAVRATAIFGGVLVGVGLGFELAGVLGTDPRMPVSELRATSEINQLGGIALMAMGICLLALAAMLTEWHFPTLSLSKADAPGARVP